MKFIKNYAVLTLFFRKVFMQSFVLYYNITEISVCYIIFCIKLHLG